MSDPSPERVRRALAQGRFPHAPRLTVAASVSLALATTSVALDGARAAFHTLFRHALDAATSPDPAVTVSLVETLSVTLRASAFPLGASLLAMVFAHVAQTGARVAWPGSTARADDGASPWIDALWALSLSAVALHTLWSALWIDGSLRTVAGLGDALSTALRMGAWRLALTSLGIGAAELAWRRAAWTRAMTPTRSEALAEQRALEGDPRVRAAVRTRGSVSEGPSRRSA